MCCLVCQSYAFNHLIPRERMSVVFEFVIYRCLRDDVSFGLFARGRPLVLQNPLVLR